LSLSLPQYFSHVVDVNEGGRLEKVLVAEKAEYGVNFLQQQHQAIHARFLPFRATFLNCQPTSHRAYKIRRNVVGSTPAFIVAQSSHVHVLE
jgi:hypothetical protein